MYPPIEQTFTSESIPVGDPLAFWRAFCNFLGAGIESCDGPTAGATMTFRKLADYWCVERAAPYMRAGQPRGRRAVLAGFYLLVCQLSGRGVSRQGGREVAFAPGDLVLIDLALPCDCTMGCHRSQMLCIPRHELESHITETEHAVNARIPADSPVAVLLSAYLDVISDADGTADTGLNSALVGHASRLVALSLGRDGSRVSGVRERVNLARREAALSFIDCSLTDTELTPARVAVQLGISRRTLDRVFKDSALTFSQCVRRRRLAAARRLLVDLTMTVTDIAFAVGFNDLSTFNRAFRAQYGLTPREVRQLLVSREDHGTRDQPLSRP